MLKNGWLALAANHPFKEVEDGNMADYHLLLEETGSPSFSRKPEETFGFHTLKLSPLALLSRRPQSKISQTPPLHENNGTAPSPSAPNDARFRTPTSGRILLYLSKSRYTGVCAPQSLNTPSAPQFVCNRSQGLQRPMRFKPPNCKRLQGAADARRRARRRLLYFKCPTTKQMRCPVNAYICLNSPKAQVSINYSFLKIKASVLMERPGVHVQSRVAAAVAMINIQQLETMHLLGT